MAAHRGSVRPARARRPERLGYRGVDGPGLDRRRGRDGSFADGLAPPRSPAGALAVAARLDLGGRQGAGPALGVRRLREVLPGWMAGRRARCWRPAATCSPAGAAPQPAPGSRDRGPGSEQEVAVIDLGGGAVCTSSTGIHRWQTEEGRVVHHLLDPVTGEPGGDGILSVTVAGDDPHGPRCAPRRSSWRGHAGSVPGPGHGLAAWWIRGGRPARDDARRAGPDSLAGRGLGRQRPRGRPSP